MISLSDSEWKLMNIMWENNPVTITQLVTLLKEDCGWSKHTIITMLSRLQAKGAVDFEQGEKAKRFFPIIKKKNAQIKETKSFLSKLYGGSVGIMLNTMIKENKLSKEEIDELYSILKKAEGDKNA